MTLETDSFAKKMTARDVCFSSGGIILAGGGPANKFQFVGGAPANNLFLNLVCFFGITKTLESCALTSLLLRIMRSLEILCLTCLAEGVWCFIHQWFTKTGIYKNRKFVLMCRIQKYQCFSSMLKIGGSIDKIVA